MDTYYKILWENFEKHSRDIIRGLWDDVTLCDILIECEGGRLIKAHKAVLAGGSPHLKEVIIAELGSTQPLQLPGVNPIILREILRFMYLGEATISPSLLLPYLKTAKELRITGLFHLEEPAHSLGREQTVEPSTNTLTTIAPTHSQYGEELENIRSVPGSIVNEYPSYPFSRPWKYKPVVREKKMILLSQKKFLLEKETAQVQPTENTHGQMHTGEKKLFHCTLCIKNFTRFNTLKEHERTHTGDRPLRCTLCARTFRWKSNMYKHMKSHQKPAFQVEAPGKQDFLVEVPDKQAFQVEEPVNNDCI